MSTNKYTRALKHLKNKSIDEKLELLTELPTNHTTGLYVDVPGSEVTPPEVPGPIDSPANFNQDGDGEPGYDGKDTTGLFEEDGTIRTIEPPGDTSYILGPMSAMWYAWANYTQIGYIRQEDRKMVNLGRITGELEDWDGETGFTDYGQMTLEQAVWFKNTDRYNDYRAFYPGPPSSTPDSYGRYYCTITGTSKPTSYQPPTGYEPGTQKGGNPDDNLSLSLNKNKNKNDGFDWDNLWDMVDAGLLVLDAISLAGLLFPELGSSVLGGLGLGAVRVLRGIKTVLRGGRTINKFTGKQRPGGRGQQRITHKIKNKESNKTYDNPTGKPKSKSDTKVDSRDLPDFVNKANGPFHKETSGRIRDRTGREVVQPNGAPPTKWGDSTGTSRSVGSQRFFNAFELQGNTLLEQNLDTVDLPEIIRNLVKNNITSNMKKTSGNLTNKDIEDYMVDRLITLTKDPKFEKNLDKLMSKLDKSKGIKESLTESKKTNIFKNVKKKFEVPEFPKKFKVKPIGRKNKSVGNKMMEIPSVPKEYKPQPNIWQRKDYYKNIRASQETKNQVLELVGAAEHHWTYLTIDRRKEKQEKINEIMSAEFDKSLELMYENYKKNGGKKIDTLVNKLRTNIAPEYPKDPSPTLDPNTGMHPKYGKHYKHDKLDPHSAEAMPSTGNPVIDVNVKKAYDPIKKERKIKNLIGKIKENS